MSYTFLASSRAYSSGRVSRAAGVVADDHRQPAQLVGAGGARRQRSDASSANDAAATRRRAAHG